MRHPKPQSLQIAISLLCLSSITLNIFLYIFWNCIDTDNMEWVLQMINVLMGIFGIVIIYQRRTAFLVYYFYTLLLFIVLMVCWTTYDYHTQMASVPELMTIKLEKIQETDEMYVTQKKLSCCEDTSITESKLNSLTGSCCGKEDNEVCESITDVFRSSCLPLMIKDKKMNLNVRLSLAIVQELLLFITSVSSLLLNASVNRELKRNEPQQKEGEAE